jgi:hypothetical protein
MNQADALDLVRSAIWTVMLASGPAIVAAMLVGVLISLLQALCSRRPSSEVSCSDFPSKFTPILSTASER